jgi:hypothetical protein
MNVDLLDLSGEEEKAPNAIEVPELEPGKKMILVCHND